MSDHLTWTCCKHCAPHVNAEIDGRNRELEALRAKLDIAVNAMKTCRHYMTDGGCPEDVVGEIDEALLQITERIEKCTTK